MNTGKVVANAGSHRILYAMSLGACTSKELKNIVGAINSVSRFDGEYMARLVANGFVRRDGEYWLMTKSGHEKLDQLGPAKGLRLRSSLATSRHSTFKSSEVYDPAKYPGLPRRPGSEDFLQCPSRMADKLYYRDGRIKNVGEPNGN